MKVLAQVLNDSNTVVAMVSRGDEIRKAREARGLSQAALGKAVGITQSAVRKIESGETVKSKFLYEIEAYLNISREGHFTPPPSLFSPGQKLPVYAAAEGGNGHMIVDFNPLDWVPRPQMFEDVPDAYAILITGESMSPAFEPGDLALVHPRLPPIRGADVIVYEIAEDGEAKASIKRLVSWTDTEWCLQQYNPAKTFKLKRSEWPKCHRVVGKFSRR